MSARVHAFCAAVTVVAIVACSSGSDDGSAGAGAAAGVGGAAGNGGAGGSGAMPASGSLNDIGAFLDGQGFKVAPWASETPGPRMPSSTVSPHQRVQVFLNDIAVASQKAGNGEIGGTPHTAGSMAVKLLYDAADQVVGTAAMLKTDGGAGGSAWTYFCYGPAGRCNTSGPAATREAPIYGQGSAVGCFSCHNGTIYTKLP